MTRVFGDAFFYIAVLNRNDVAHRQARTYVLAGKIEIVTTTAVLLEVADALAAPACRTRCGEFLAELVSHVSTSVLKLDDALLGRGLALYRARPDKNWSLTDCISFIVMTDEGLSDALTGDRHFEQAGFRALLAS